MTREIQMLMTAVLTTALETEPAAFPESYAYIAAGMNLPEWEDAKHVMTALQLITIEPGPQIRLTNKGRDIAQKLNAAITKKAPAQ